MPVIPTPEEAEIRSIIVQSQLHVNSFQDPIPKITQSKTGLAE
jgi:hypothetical protein